MPTPDIAFSAALQANILGWVQGNAFPDAPASIKFGLMTAKPNGDGTGVIEISGIGYARQVVDFGDITVLNGVSSIKNTNAIIFGPASGDWAQLAWGGFFDGVSGDLIAYGLLAAPRTCPNDDTISFGVGALQLRSQ